MKSLILALLLASVPAQAALKLSDKPAAQNFLFEKDPKALASSVQLVFRTGSLADPKGKEGLAMLSFRSLLGGSKARSKEEFLGTLERLGASLDVDIGAGRTILSLNVVSDNLEKAVELLAEATLTPGLRDADINNGKQELLASLHQQLSNNRAILKRVYRQALFRGTALAFPPEGTTGGVASITPDDVRAFLAQQIKSGRAVVAVSTNIPEAKVRGWIEKAFAAMPEGPAPSLNIPEVSAPEGRTIYVVDRQGSATTEITLGHLGILANNKDREVLETGLYAFGEDMTSRLFQELREKRGWTYGAAGGWDIFERPRRYPGGFMVWAFPQAEHTEELVLKALALYEDYAKRGLTAKELNFARQALTNSYPFQFATSRARLTVRLYELLEGAPHRSVPQYRAILNRITTGSLAAAVKRVHDPANLVIVLVGDPARTAGLLTKIPKVKKVVRVTDPMAAM